MKIKFPIILKIGLLGLLSSGVVLGVSLSISNSNQLKRSKETLINNIDQSLSVVEYNFTIGEDGYDPFPSLETILNYVKDDVYSRPDIHDKTLEDFASFEEYEAYFKKRAPYIIPDPTAMIGSEKYFEFRKVFREINHIVTEAFLSSGAKASYLCFRDVVSENETRIVFAIDSRITLPDKNDKFYHLPGSHYVLKESDKFIDNQDEDYYGYYINGRSTRLTPIYRTEDGISEEVALVFIEYDLNDVQKQSQAILLNELLVLAIAMAITIAVYMTISYFFIARNLNKLTKATDHISGELNAKRDIVPSDLKFRSHDEIASLAASFNLMEHEIVNYVNIIKNEAKENERRAAELEVASNIQLSALPEHSYCDNNLSYESYIKPAKVVGGDFYDYFYNDGEFIIIIADVSGKGIPAAMFMMKAKTLLKSKILSGRPLKDAVSDVNNELTINNESSLFVTAFIASINFEKNEIRFINAGHEKPYIVHNGEVIKLDGTSNFVLGGEEDINYVEEKVKFEKGDVLFTFTDGLNESINNKNEEFGYDRIVETLKESSGLSLSETLNLFNEKLKEFVGEEEQFDDITMIALENKDNTLKLSYDKKDYSIIEDALNKFEESFSALDSETKAHVGIALDELLNNLVSYEKREDLKIDIDFKLVSSGFEVVITCNGDEYNPFNKTHKDKLEKIDENTAPGGFGVSLVKTISKKQKYEYKNNSSIITLLF